MYTNVQFDYGGCYSEDYEWISRNSIYVILFKTSILDEITYSVLVEKICRKIGVDETNVKLKLSYNLSNCPREIYIVDDEEVLSYMTTLDKEGLKPLLHVELSNGMENNERVDQLSRAELRSSCGVNYEEPVFNGSVENVAIVTIEEQHNESIFDDLRETPDNGDDGDRENVPHDESETVHSPINNLLEAFVHDSVDLPPHVEAIENVDEWEDGTGLELKQAFSSREAVQDLVLRAANKYCFEYKTVASDKERLMLKCRQSSKGCRWYLRVAREKNSAIWTVRVHRKMHSCSRTSESTSNMK